MTMTSENLTPAVARHAAAAITPLRQRAIRAVLAHRLRVHNPTLRCHDTSIWDYGFGDLDAIELGREVSVGPFTEIVVQKHSRHSSVEGRLIIGDRAVISSGANIRAAGGTIRIGAGSAISQNSVLVAANHRFARGKPYLHVPWDEERTGIDIGDNVWVGALCVVVAGVTIGRGSMIAAGSVVTGNVPPLEVWGGVPARRIKDVPAEPQQVIRSANSL